MKKWAVPAYIRGFDSFKPPMSRFCLWKAALFTRFWSLHLPLLAWLTRFWSRNFSQGDLIYEVLISGKTIYIYYIYNVYTRFWSRLRHSDGLLYTRFWSSAHKFRRLYARGFDLSAGVAQGADSRGLYLSPTCGIPKTRSKPRKWGDAGRGRRWTPNVIHFHKKATRYWESDWAVSTKNVDFCRKRGGKNRAAPHKRGWNSQKAVKSNNALQSLPINSNFERSYRKWYNRRDQNLVNRLPEWHCPRKCPSAGEGRDQNLVNPQNEIKTSWIMQHSISRIGS